MVCYRELSPDAADFINDNAHASKYNYLTEVITEPSKDHLALWLLRLAFIGFMASLISDSVSNSLRVVKTYRQVNDTKVSYGKGASITFSSLSNAITTTAKAARLVIDADGLSGLFGRGLGTRILCNGLQGILFTILWKLFLDL